MKMNFVKTGINGEGIGYDHRKPVFCDGVLAGETAVVRIEEDHGTYAKARCVRLLKPSENRIDAACPYQSECGGCPLMILKYDAQLQVKSELLQEALFKYGKVRSHFVRSIRGSEKTEGWRSQCKLPAREIDGTLYSGMYRANSNHFIPVKNCRMHDSILEKTRKQVMKVLNQKHIPAYDSKTGKGLRYLIMRAIGENVQCTLVTGKDTVDNGTVEAMMKIPHMTSLFQSVNTGRRTVEIFGPKTKLLTGSRTIPVQIQDITLQLSPQAFFQLNVDQAVRLYETAISKIDPCDVLVEAYCGIGAMSLMAHNKAQKIIGIENVPDAIRDAKANAEENHIGNVEFICADAADGLLKAASRHHINTLLADPPRSGMDERMLEAVLKVHPDKIIYISCNPATLGRNLKELKHAYHVVTVIPFDLFPNTPHVESITVLEADTLR